MNKRELAATPRPYLTEENKKFVLLVQSLSYLVTVQKMVFSGENTLILNFFKKEKGKLKPSFRTFCQKDDYISQDLTTSKTKWKTGAIDYLTGYMYWYRHEGNICIASMEERDLIIATMVEYTGEDMDETTGSSVDYTITSIIDNYQNRIKAKKLEAKHEKLKAAIDIEMGKFQEIPADYDDFIENTVFGMAHYIFYSKVKKQAYCTSCRKEFEITPKGTLRHKTIPVWYDTDKVKHNHTVICPFCHKVLMCKSDGMSRGKLFEVEWSVLVQKHNEEVLVRYFCHTKDFRTNYRNPIIKTNELYRTVHTKKSYKDYMWDRFKSTNEYRWVEYREKSYGWSYPRETAAPRSAVLYRSNLEEAVAGTCMKYSAIDIYVDKVVDINNSPWCVDWYFNAYRKKPYLEQLLKVGFYSLTKEILKNQNVPEFTNGKNVVETLQIDRIRYKMLLNVGNPNLHDLKILRYAKTIKESDFQELRLVDNNSYTEMYKKYIDLMEYTSLYKIMKYLRKANCPDNDYFDYIKWLKELDYDMKNEFNLYPTNFKASHDEKMAEYQAMLDKKKREEMRRFSLIIEKMREERKDIPVFNLHFNGLMIVSPKSSKDLKIEGQTLHHCVGGYAEQVAKGETIILFIRKEAEPEKPYFTLEWKGKLVQCRGMKNCSMTDDVKQFVDKFIHQMNLYEQSLQRKQRKAG